MTNVKTIRATIVAFLSIVYCAAVAQTTSLVSWKFTTEIIAPNEIRLTITADIAPGWYIYSQHLSDDGPQPTRISFKESDSYFPIGTTIEDGDPNTYHDEIFDMEITSYTQKVSYRQDFRVHDRETLIIGTIDFMVCDSQMCMPGRKEFSVTLKK